MSKSDSFRSDRTSMKNWAMRVHTCWHPQDQRCRSLPDTIGGPAWSHHSSPPRRPASPFLLYNELPRAHWLIVAPPIANGTRHTAPNRVRLHVRGDRWRMPYRGWHRMCAVEAVVDGLLGRLPPEIGVVGTDTNGVRNNFVNMMRTYTDKAEQRPWHPSSLSRVSYVFPFSRCNSHINIYPTQKTCTQLI